MMKRIFKLNHVLSDKKMTQHYFKNVVGDNNNQRQ